MWMRMGVRTITCDTCVQRLWMRVCLCTTICASMRAALANARAECVLPLVLAYVQRLWMRVGVCITTCASMRAADVAVDAPERV